LLALFLSEIWYFVGINKDCVCYTNQNTNTHSEFIEITLQKKGLIVLAINSTNQITKGLDKKNRPHWVIGFLIFGGDGGSWTRVRQHYAH